MNKNAHPSLQVNIVCLLLGLIGATANMKHPDWIGSVPKGVSLNLEFVAPYSN